MLCRGKGNLRQLRHIRRAIPPRCRSDRRRVSARAVGWWIAEGLGRWLYRRSPSGPQIFQEWAVRNPRQM